MDDFQQEAQDVEDVVSDSPAESVEVESQEAETEAPEPKVVFDEAQQAKVNSLISDKVAKTHEERRRGDDLEKQVADLKAQIPQQIAPDVPTLPNPDDIYTDPEKYQRDIQSWQTATEQHAVFDANNRMVEGQQQAQAQQLQQEAALKQQESIQNYATVAQSFNITSEQMQQDAAQFGQARVPLETQDFILHDPQGPLIAAHLANDVVELDKISRMTPTRASAYIATELRPKLASVRKATKAPKPAEILGGAGVPDKVNQLTKDAVFSS